ncbi:Zinc finger CCCH-type [Trinorchestia longiramus]|nr:Zinc finger CCCH-type [Trinorchestia longiramus]
MPPIVSQITEHHHTASHPQLQRTSTVLRSHYDRTSGDSEPNSPQQQPHHKVIGGHLMLSKQSSTPAGHPALSASFLSVTVNQASKLGFIPNTGASEGLLGAPNMDQGLFNGGGLHRRLDRSHSEPVWPQQQQQQQQDNRPGSNSSRYKTELCRPFEENGFCKYGDKCQFAHGGVELRTLNRHPKYKTELCRTFHTIGICPYGPRCHFIHNAEESRVVSPIMATMSMSGPLPPSMHMTSSPPPALIPSPHTPLSSINSPLTPLPTIFDKHSPPSSTHGGSPTTPGVFFDDTFSFFQGLEGLAETLAQSLHFNNNKCNNYQANLNTQLNNHMNNRLNTNGSNCSSSGSVSPVTCQFGDLLNEAPTFDTPPASPPDSSSPTGEESGPHSSLRLPIFQSINPVQ